MSIVGQRMISWRTRRRGEERRADRCVRWGRPALCSAEYNAGSDRSDGQSPMPGRLATRPSSLVQEEAARDARIREMLMLVDADQAVFREAIKDPATALEVSYFLRILFGLRRWARIWIKRNRDKKGAAAARASAGPRIENGAQSKTQRRLSGAQGPAGGESGNADPNLEAPVQSALGPASSASPAGSLLGTPAPSETAQGLGSNLSGQRGSIAAANCSSSGGREDGSAAATTISSGGGKDGSAAAAPITSGGGTAIATTISSGGGTATATTISSGGGKDGSAAASPISIDGGTATATAISSGGGKDGSAAAAPISIGGDKTGSRPTAAGPSGASGHLDTESAAAEISPTNTQTGVGGAASSNRAATSTAEVTVEAQGPLDGGRVRANMEPGSTSVGASTGSKTAGRGAEPPKMEATDGGSSHHLSGLEPLGGPVGDRSGIIPDADGRAVPIDTELGPGDGRLDTEGRRAGADESVGAAGVAKDPVLDAYDGSAASLDVPVAVSRVAGEGSLGAEDGGFDQSPGLAAAGEGYSKLGGTGTRPEPVPDQTAATSHGGLSSAAAADGLRTVASVTRGGSRPSSATRAFAEYGRSAGPTLTGADGDKSPRTLIATGSGGASVVRGSSGGRGPTTEGNEDQGTDPTSGLAAGRSPAQDDGQTFGGADSGSITMETSRRAVDSGLGNGLQPPGPPAVAGVSLASEMGLPAGIGKVTSSAPSSDGQDGSDASDLHRTTTSGEDIKTSGSAFGTDSTSNRADGTENGLASDLRAFGQDHGQAPAAAGSGSAGGAGTAAGSQAGSHTRLEDPNAHDNSGSSRGDGDGGSIVDLSGQVDTRSSGSSLDARWKPTGSGELRAGARPMEPGESVGVGAADTSSRDGDSHAAPSSEAARHLDTAASELLAGVSSGALGVPEEGQPTVLHEEDARRSSQGAGRHAAAVGDDLYPASADTSGLQPQLEDSSDGTDVGIGLTKQSTRSSRSRLEGDIPSAEVEATAAGEEGGGSHIPADLDGTPAGVAGHASAETFLVEVDVEGARGPDEDGSDSGLRATSESPTGVLGAAATARGASGRGGQQDDTISPRSVVRGRQGAASLDSGTSGTLRRSTGGDSEGQGGDLRSDAGIAGASGRGELTNHDSDLASGVSAVGLQAGLGDEAGAARYDHAQQGHKTGGTGASRRPEGSGPVLSVGRGVSPGAVAAWSVGNDDHANHHHARAFPRQLASSPCIHPSCPEEDICIRRFQQGCPSADATAVPPQPQRGPGFVASG